MTEELARFALMLKEADRVRARIAEGEAAERSKEAAKQEVSLGVAT